jgi:type IV pilus biogenesis protein CpaD/CtpE
MSGRRLALMPKRKPQTPAQLRAAEHKSLLRALASMTRLATKQAEVLGSFMKTYEVAAAPTSRVMSDEREWLQEQEDEREMRREAAATMTALPNPFLAMEMD